MFRNPRENANLSIKAPVKPSTGRAPTPPNESHTPRSQSTATMSSGVSAKPLTPRPNSKSNMPEIGKPTAKKTAFSKTPGRSNTSILSFFKKVDSPLQNESIFMSQGSQANKMPVRQKSPSVDLMDGISSGLYDAEDNPRFNEVGGPAKKRKTSPASTKDSQGSEWDTMAVTGLEDSIGISESPSSPMPTRSKAKKPRRKGPFLSDSDTDDDVDFTVQKASTEQKVALDASVYKQPEDMNEIVETKSVKQDLIQSNKPVVPEIKSVKPIERGRLGRKRVQVAEGQVKWEALQPNSPAPVEEVGNFSSSESGSEYNENPVIPTLKKEATSIDEWGRFEDLEDDEFGEGEEFQERKWMEEQASLEAAEAAFAEEGSNDLDDEPPDEQPTSACPICSANLAGITNDQATRHVNGCLDGNPVPLPASVKSEIREPKYVKLMPVEAKGRFARKSAVPRPGQSNPFDLDAPEPGPCNAFSTLMSGKAEDAAWASAAAAENASRGKPAYQRTCPFYKIMPGFFICVDAFRYGAVQGCNAYFLSHFHSDHYIGLTSTWCHGPIYCSKVTANLVKQQLRVDPKWVVSLEFEARFEVPGTQGVAVTMIPANHCPGSSLYLFEKIVGRGANPKVQRVLHCGDFRACPAHIAHPLLMPDIVDSITGKTKQQKIDVCYLDTTYLNPRYAFPSQEEVIKACADMCVSLKKERAEEGDAWEVVKRQRAGAGMTNFVNNTSSGLKSEDNSIAMEIGSKKDRGRLLVICGTYSIGKERICMGIARALDCKIWAPPGKMRICAALEDPELMSRMTDDPKEAQIHMQMLMEIRAETLQEYLNSYKPHFSRIVGFRPSGWNYRPPNSRFTDSPSIPTILHSTNWRSTYSMSDLSPQRGSTREASCFGVPYSEHSSFRELTMFICALRIEKVVPTVNVGSAPGRAKMKAWIERWLAERRKNGVVRVGMGEGEVRW